MAWKRLSGMDAAFLAAESPGNWLHIMAVLLLDPSTVPGGYTFARFRDDLAMRLRCVPPLYRRLVEMPLRLANPVWVDVAEIDFDRHLKHAALPAPGGPAELARLASDMLERPLDRRRPLWELVVVEGVEGGRIALLAKLHHAMMDGMAGMQFMASLLTREPDTAGPEPARIPSASGPPSTWALVRSGAPQVAARPVRAARAVVSTVGSLIAEAWRRDETGTDVAEPVSVRRMWLNARTTPERSVAFGSLSLDAVRTVAHAMEATVNDVVLAVVGGALRSDLSARGVLPDEPVVAGVPVSTHDVGDELANAISVIFVGLGTDEADPVERLRAIRDDARRAKQRRSGRAGSLLGAWVDVPRPWEMALLARLVIDVGLMHRIPPLCNLVVSNVPGPPVALHLGGARLVGIHPLGPIYDGIGLNVTVLSREDRALDFGLVALGSLIRDPWPLADALGAALDELVAAVVPAATTASPTRRPEV